jgi:hypothetical protein
MDAPYTATGVAQSSVGFSNNNAVVLIFTVPQGKTSGYAKFSFSEAGGGAVTRTISMSTQPCDWSAANAVGGTTSPWTPLEGASSSGQFMAGVGPGGLVAGTTYFVNIKNVDASGAPTCFSGNCDIVTNFQGR